MSWLVSLAGVGVLVVAVVDVFLVVLYLRGGAGLVTPAVSEATWRAFRGLGRLRPASRDRVLSFAGPVLLVVIAMVWGLLVWLGCTLLVWPWLGGAVQASSGPTPGGFGVALSYAAMSLTTLGTGDLVPTTVPARLATVAMAALGFSLLTLVVTYFLSVYNALLRRNAFAVDLHYRTGSTGDAAVFLARAGAGGDPAPAAQDLRQIVQETVHLQESHHFYPVLHYFRYEQERYALARIALVVLDAYSLIRTALAEDAYPALVRGGAAAAAWEAGRELLEGLGRTFLPGAAPPAERLAAETERRWRERYRVARRRLAGEGLRLAPAWEGEEAYLALRRRWQPWVEAFARRLDYDLDRILDAEAPGPSDPGPGASREA